MKGKHLAYCDKDMFLGIGYDLFAPEATEPQKWTGANLVGQALMKIRDNLLAKAAEERVEKGIRMKEEKKRQQIQERKRKLEEKRVDSEMLPRKIQKNI